MARWFRRRWKIWNTREEKPPADEFLPFDKWTLRFYRLGFWLAPSWLFIDTRSRYQTTGKKASKEAKADKRIKTATARYVMAWFFILVAIWLLNPDNGTLAKVAAGIALFRLFEISISVLGFVLGQREPRIARSLVTIAILGMQVALIFSIVDNAFAHNDFLAPKLPMGYHNAHPAATTPFEYLYLSWTYMITIGNAYTPATELARYLQVAATTSGILLLGVVAARAIGLAGSTEAIVSGLQDKEEPGKPKSRREGIGKRLRQ